MRERQRLGSPPPHPRTPPTAAVSIDLPRQYASEPAVLERHGEARGRGYSCVDVSDSAKTIDLPHDPTAKAALRERLRARLGAIDPETAAVAADRVAERVLALPEIARAGRILTCLSFGIEIDTWRLVERLLGTGREIFVPRAARDGRLHLHPYPCALSTLAFGLRQPPAGAPELAEGSVDGAIDAVLVLGLGFDRRGYRLGYGSGYFDRFLARRAFPALGLAFAAQLLNEIPAEAHDIPMAAIVTEAEVCRPSGARRTFSPS